MPCVAEIIIPLPEQNLLHQVARANACQCPRLTGGASRDLRFRRLSPRQRHQRAGHDRDQAFNTVKLRERPGLAHRQGAARLDDAGAKRKALAPGGRKQVGLEFHGQDIGTRRHQREGGDTGGFYRRFRDRAALLEGILQNWSAGRIAAIEQQTSLDGATARDRLRALIRLYSERMNTEGMAVELAIRQWARSDEAAANAVASVDAARLQNVGQLYRATGLSDEQADAQAFLFYCFIFGQSLLFLERGPRKRAQLIAKSAEKLLDDES
jgi:AcrR family transcriptional regulator